MAEASVYTPYQRVIVELWEEHTAHEFVDRSSETTLAQDLLVRRAEEG